jgi:MarR-like DNA-binding transcriptional regulator SgrR of sgrS sRNA
MKRCNSLLLAASSLLWLALWSGAASQPALAESRPHYGGTLRVTLKAAPPTLDPAAGSVPASISRLIFETLVALDDHGRPQPLLAASWQADPGSQRWRFFIRGGINFQDGTPLDATAAAASLRASNPGWKVSAAADTIMIEAEYADIDLPTELALPRNSIVRRDNTGKLSGTGPFVVAQWDSGKHATLAANDQYWAGRAFLDSIQIDFGKNDRDQMLALDLGKAEVVEVAPENIHRLRAENRIIMTSEPEELMALVFAQDPRSDDEAHARNALALSIDTAAVNNVVLQGGGEPSGALVPNWLSGYAFVFPSGGSADRVRQERTLAKRVPAWILGYDGSDSIAQVTAQRILLNARDAGIALQLVSAGNSDLRLVRIPLPSSDPQTALAELATVLQLPQPKPGNSSVSDLYSAEKTLLQSHRVIPLLHLRSAVAVRPNVHGLSISPDGTWQLGNVWLSGEKP